MTERRRLITILGPTASGKTSVAAHLAARIGGEIISGDSRQVYRRMDIGTGKDIADYTVDGVSIPYHLIDIAEPGTKYNLFQYQEDFHKAYNDITARSKTAILCGGTGLYIEAVLKGYNLSPVPQNQILRDKLSDKSLDELTAMLIELKQRNHSTMHNQTDVDTCQRAIRAIEIETYNLEHPTEERALPAVEATVIGIDISREDRRQRISNRLKARLDEGMIDEIKGIINSGVDADDLIYYGLEYKYVTEYVVGKISYDEMFTQLEIAIHQFAKRQMTWFRGMERRGTHIHWIDYRLPMEEKVNEIIRIVDKNNEE
ncbi:MAG: tRNA (adenosine(37)-N6)-dimethylallyltransferase MiaA [Prevotella sp.]|nr:tRNA (adenosine(37)-N6)-dimethylallyltransferase MiaA [Prevotella sp.]